MSDLDKVVALSITVACTMGLEPLMFPTGLIEVMVTPLEPPRLAPPLAPDLVLGLDLFEVLCLLDLPTRTSFLAGRVRCLRIPLPRTVFQPLRSPGRADCFHPAHQRFKRLRAGERPRFRKSFAPGTEEPHFRGVSRMRLRTRLYVLLFRTWSLDPARTTSP